VRTGPNYSRNGKKAPSKASFYECCAVDLVAAERRIDVFGEKVMLPEIPAHFKGLDLPPLFIANCQIPHDGPSFSGIRGDGKCSMAVYYFRLTEATVAELKAGEDTYSNALKLLIKFVREAETDKVIRQYFKVICLVENMAELGMGSLSKLSGKPVLARATGTATTREDFMEFDINVHNFSAIARKSLQSAQGYVANMEQQVGFVIQGTTDAELPEQMLGVTRVHLTDFTKGRPFGSIAEDSEAGAKSISAVPVSVAETTGTGVQPELQKSGTAVAVKAPPESLPDVREKRGGSFTGIFRKRNSARSSTPLDADKMAKAAAGATIAEQGEGAGSSANAVDLRIDPDASPGGPGWDHPEFSTKSGERVECQTHQFEPDLDEKLGEDESPRPLFSWFICGCGRRQQSSVEMVHTPPQSPRSTQRHEPTATPVPAPAPSPVPAPAISSSSVLPGPPLHLAEEHAVDCSHPAKEEEACDDALPAKEDGKAASPPQGNPVAIRVKAKSKARSAPPPLAPPASAPKGKSVNVNLRMVDGNGEEKSWLLQMDESSDVRRIKDALAERTGSDIDHLELYMTDDSRVADDRGGDVSGKALIALTFLRALPDHCDINVAADHAESVSPAAAGQVEHTGEITNSGSAGKKGKKKRVMGTSFSKVGSRVGSKLGKWRSPLRGRARSKGSSPEGPADASINEENGESDTPAKDGQGGASSPRLRDDESVESLLQFAKEFPGDSDASSDKLEKELRIRLVAPT
jgi:hypothetical protein